MKIIKVLVACEESQAVAMAFNKDANAEAERNGWGIRFFAMSCDLQDCSGGHPEYHHKGDAIAFAETFQPDLTIAHPPCTYLSNVGSNHLTKYINGTKYVDMKRYQQGMEGKEFFMKWINCNCKYIAVENPTPTAIWGLPPYTQAIQPWEFGDPYTKRTCLWLKGLPTLKPTHIVEPIGSWCVIHRTAKQRSKTFTGIAKAMALQWGSFLNTEFVNNNL